MPRPNHTPGGAAVLERYAAHLGIPVWDPPFKDYPWWNGTALRRPNMAEDWAHEIAHWLLATPEGRQLVDYGWGQDADFMGRDDEDPDKLGPLPWPDPDSDWPPTSEEILACVLGFAFLVRVGEPAPYDCYGFYTYTYMPGDEPGSVIRRIEAATYAERRQVQPHVEAIDRWRADPKDTDRDAVPPRTNRRGGTGAGGETGMWW